MVLTTILISLSLLYSGGGDIEERPREFCFFMLVLETGLLGTLLAVDLFLFYVFWEVMLFPMYFLIGIWGHGRKIYAAVKFVLFTMIGSLLMLVAILYLVYQAHVHFNRHSPSTCRLLYKMPLTADRRRAGCSPRSRSRSRSRFRCGRCIPGCPTRIPTRRPPAR